MTERVEPEVSKGTMLTPATERFLEEFVKEAFNEAVEQPVNSLIKGINYLTGNKFPQLDITGIPERPPKPVKFIKA